MPWWVGGGSPHHLCSEGYSSSDLLGSSKDDSFQREESEIRNPNAGPQRGLGRGNMSAGGETRLQGRGEGASPGPCKIGSGGGVVGPGGASPKVTPVRSDLGTGEGSLVLLNSLPMLFRYPILFLFSNYHCSN